MKAAMALGALLMSACAGTPVESRSAQPVSGDTCAVVRPDFGVASAAERNLFAYDVDAPLNLQKTVEDTINGVEVSAISFDSPAGGRTTGLFFDPVTRTGPRPGIVLLHGMPGNAQNAAGFGTGLATDGAVVIALDAPFARRSGDPLRFTEEDRTEQIQLMKDLQRAVDVLRAHPNVDDQRIAFHGISYGGAMGALFVGIEARIKAAVLVVPDGGLVTHSSSPAALEYMAAVSCAMRNAWFRAMTPIEPIRFFPHATAALLVQSGRSDNLVPAADAEELHAAAPDHSTILWYDAGHGLNQQAFFDGLDWLHEQVGLDPRE